jgi:hypothetical protein
MGIGNSKCRNALGLLAFSVLAAGFQRPVASPSQFLLIAAGAFAGIATARSGLLRLWQVLLAYGFAARIPVPVVILLGILNGWNTHYDSAPPGLPDLGSFARWIAIGVIPQFTIWIVGCILVNLAAQAGGCATAYQKVATSNPKVLPLAVHQVRGQVVASLQGRLAIPQSRDPEQRNSFANEIGCEDAGPFRKRQTVFEGQEFPTKRDVVTVRAFVLHAHAVTSLSNR